MNVFVHGFRKPNSELKKKEMSGSGIFCKDTEDDQNGASLPLDKTMVRPLKVRSVSFLIQL